MFAGFTRRRWLDASLMRVTDALIAFPFIILALALALVLGSSASFGPFPPGIPAVILAIWLVNWTMFARLARAETLVLCDQDFITAARLLGYSNVRIIRRHLLPSVLRRNGAYAVTNTVVIIGTIAGLSFLGAGAQPPTPEWGALMLDGRSVLGTAWWVTIFPSLALGATVLGLSLVADGLSTRGEGG
jgi:peptide/nickel transport system permease protein